MTKAYDEELRAKLLGKNGRKLPALWLTALREEPFSYSYKLTEPDELASSVGQLHKRAEWASFWKQSKEPWRVETANRKPKGLGIQHDYPVRIHFDAAIDVLRYLGEAKKFWLFCQRVEKIQADLAKTRVHALYNKAVKVPGRDFWLAGVDYPMLREEKKFQQLKAKFTENALADIPAEERPRTILLAHHPEFIDDAAAAGVLLTLTGHTHGCQFGVLGLPLFPVFKYNRGLVEKGASYGYVHSGNGSWFPCRIGCAPEIAYFTVQ